MASKIITVALLGSGSRAEKYFNELSKMPNVRIVAVLVNEKLPKFLESFTGQIVRGGNVEDLLKHRFDVAIVALPHHCHQAVTLALLRAGIRVIKEKPLAMTLRDCLSFKSPISTTVQRNFHPAFLQAKERLFDLGEIRSFTYRYSLALPSMTSGWRAEKGSGGGVINDMGYHAFERVIDFFGMPQKVQGKLEYIYPEMREKNLEDGAEITLDYGAFQGKVLLHRHAEKADEVFIIQGTKGTITMTQKGWSFEDLQGNLQSHPTPITKEQLTSDMLAHFLDAAKREEHQKAFERNLATVELIEKVLANSRI